MTSCYRIRWSQVIMKPTDLMRGWHLIKILKTKNYVPGQNSPQLWNARTVDIYTVNFRFVISPFRTVKCYTNQTEKRNWLVTVNLRDLIRLIRFGTTHFMETLAFWCPIPYRWHHQSVNPPILSFGHCTRSGTNKKLEKYRIWLNSSNLITAI